ncbi:HobA family DNA replication regulator [Campylobacter jejuni]|nr:HobA family DNA replication regulator [Campylobacter jejuni]
MQQDLDCYLRAKVLFLCVMSKDLGMRNIFKNINIRSSRPMLPFFSLNNFCKKKLESQEDIELLNDLLEFTFPNGYVYFYIGSNLDKKCQIAKSKNDSLLWLFDEQLQNSFYLNSNDSDLDVKLITLFKLMDKSLDAILFSKVSI